MITLDKRLSAVAALVRQGSRLADIGTDHAYLPVYLVQSGVCPSAIASDIGAGPLDAARRTVTENELTSKIALRLGNGLATVSAEEVEALAAMELEKAVAEMPEGLLAQGMNDMGRGLHRRHTGTQRLLSTDWTMAFDGVRSYEGNVATPYASIFAGSFVSISSGANVVFSRNVPPSFRLRTISNL